MKLIDTAIQRTRKAETALHLSVVLLNFNTRDLTLDCLASLHGMASAEGWQLIVVDNASTDRSVEAIAQRFPAVELIVSAANVGYAAGNNLGLRRASGDYVVLLNSDIVLDPAVLDALAGYLTDQQDVAAVSPRLLTPQGTAQPYAFGDVPSLSYLLWRGLNTLIRRGALHDWAVDHPIDVDWISGACFCVRRSILDEVGLLDEHFFLYFEDTEWCMRMRRHGWRVVYNPTWSVTHLGGASQDRRRGSNPIYYESLLYLYRKHFGWLQFNLLRLAIGVYRRLVTLRW